jgi:hypothetical protein
VAAQGQAPTIHDRARGADRVVVATVADATARYQRNEFGDDLIVTHARLAVEEVIKGSAGDVMLEVEGGTVNGITMRVSDLPSVKKGERAVFFLKPGRNGEFTSHGRGEGILKLDAANRVPGTNLTLDELRRQAKTSGQ